jgi:two-component system NtrC family sensor kinase
MRSSVGQAGNMRSTIERPDTEELLKALSDETPAGICIIQDGRFRYFNSNFTIATGYSSHELIGKDSLKIIAPEDRETVRENTRKMLRGELFSPYEFRVKRKDGNTVWIVGSVKSIRYRGTRAILGNYMEVTERRQMEERARDSERRYRLLAENIADVVWTVNIAHPTRLTYISPSVSRLLGYSTDESMGKEMQEIFTPASFDSAMQAFEEEMANEQKGHAGRHRSRMLQLQLRHQNGSLVDIEANFSLIRGANGQSDEILAVARDITGRRRTEEALDKSEERYRMFTENAREAIFVVQGSMIKFMNPKGEELSGYSLRELASRPFVEFIYPDDANMVIERYSRRLKGEPVPQTYEFRIIRKEGTVRWGEINAVPTTWEGEPAILCFMNDITERKQAEDSLRESEERYRTILDEMGDGYFETDLAGNITFANDALANLLGYSRDEIVGMNSDVLRPEEQRQAVFEAYNRMYKTGQPLRNFPTEVIRKDGRHLSAETSAFPARDDRGEIIGFRGVRHDITERKQADEALRQSEERYRTILEEMEDACFEVDLGGHFTFVNGATCRSLGYSEEELMGMSYKSFTAEEDIESVFRVFNDVYQTGTPNKGFPWKTVRKDGIQGFAETSISPMRNSKGEVIGFRGVGRDITERKQAEEKLRQSEENYRALFSSSVIGTIVLDAQIMKVVMANQAAAEMLGLSSPEECIGLNPVDFVPPEDKERINELIVKEMFEQDLRQPHEIRVGTKDGREIWINATGARIMHEGRVAGLISFTDITEQKLQRERLVMTDRLASLGELAAGTAHELNNPLTSIIGFSELLMEKEVPDDIREDLKLINSEAQRATNVTRNLLTFARKHAPVKQPNQINSIIEDVLGLRAHMQKMNSIEVDKQLASNLPEVMVDYFQMQQVFLNIVINAEYFMIDAHGRGTLTVTTRQIDDTVVISIADDGPGIPEGNLGRIFDPFFTTKETGKGTGLGLSICHGLVTEQGGRLYVRSQLGRGATIFVELPTRGS